MLKSNCINQKPPITNNPKKKSSDFLTTRHQEIQLHEIPIFSTTLSKDKSFKPLSTLRLIQEVNDQTLRILHKFFIYYASYGSRRQVGLMDSQGWEKKKTKAQNPPKPTTQLVLLDRYIRKQRETVAAVAATDQLKRKNWVFMCVDFLMTKMSFEGCVCVCEPPHLLLATVCLLCVLLMVTKTQKNKTHKNKTMTIHVKD
jgi:hypothetical protein